jgi:6-phosphofructokinase 1
MRRAAAFDERITSERKILRECCKDGFDFPTEVSTVGLPVIRNPVSENKLGLYRKPTDRKAVTADMDMIDRFQSRWKRSVPSFLEAGPREFLYHDPQSVRAAVVTSGGLAPGLNSVIHSIVSRHWNTYSVNEAKRGGVFGVRNGFMGLFREGLDMERLTPSSTEHWLEIGGSMLGARRFHDEKKADLVRAIGKNLRLNDINILYVIGGDGSLGIAHEIAKAEKANGISVVGIPKTMDNDVVWVWQSFGFNTAVEKATEVVNTMHCEAESTRRVCIVELFGAESGFVAANAALASGHVDLVLVPESFIGLDTATAEKLLDSYVDYLAKNVRDKNTAHALVVVAEGVGRLLNYLKAKLGPELVRSNDFAEQLRDYLKGKLTDTTGRDIEVFMNQPRHNIRAIPANVYDQIYCERLGALAVDNALAGFTDFMISQWLTEYVLVPLGLVAGKQKSIPPGGIFWKQVVSSTGQPLDLPLKLQQDLPGPKRRSRAIRPKPTRRKRVAKSPARRR